MRPPLLAALLLAAACAHAPARAHAAETGLASWYGGELRGRRTASGERYDPGALTCAHRTHPFGAWLEVTHLGTGRTVRVRVNDRGPFAAGRVVDLSRAAARALGMLESGLARVRVVRLR